MDQDSNLGRLNGFAVIPIVGSWWALRSPLCLLEVSSVDDQTRSAFGTIWTPKGKEEFSTFIIKDWGEPLWDRMSFSRGHVGMQAQDWKPGDVRLFTDTGKIFFVVPSPESCPEHIVLSAAFKLPRTSEFSRYRDSVLIQEGPPTPPENLTIYDRILED